MSGFAEHANELLARDPLLALVVGFLNANERNRWLARLALGRELRQVALSIREQSVVSIKLHWWREELERARSNAPLHPITALLTPLPLTENELDEAINALHLLSSRLSHESADALATLLRPLALLERKLFAVNASADFDLAVADLNALHDMRSALAAERVLLPLDLLSAAGLSRSDLSDPAKQPQVATLIAQIAGRLRPGLAAQATDRAGALWLDFQALRALQLTRSPQAVLHNGAPPLPLRAAIKLWLSARRHP